MDRLRALDSWDSRLPMSRRDLLAAASVLGASAQISPAAAEPADERPKEGDYLVAVDAPTSSPNAAGLAPNDITAPVIAWPMDPAGIIRNGSRLNKVLLVRLDPATLGGPTRERAAGGV